MFTTLLLMTCLLVWFFFPSAVMWARLSNSVLVKTLTSQDTTLNLAWHRLVCTAIILTATPPMLPLSRTGRFACEYILFRAALITMCLSVLANLVKLQHHALAKCKHSSRDFFLYVHKCIKIMQTVSNYIDIFLFGVS